MDLMDYRRKIIMSSLHLSHAEGAVASFSDGTDLPLKSLLVNIEPVQSGSGDPSPSNERPISGWSAVGVTRTGKNLCDGTLQPYVQTTNRTIWYLVSNAFGETAIAPCVGGEQYTISKFGGNRLIVTEYTEYPQTGVSHPSNLLFNNSNAQSVTVTTSQNAKYIVITTSADKSVSPTAWVQLELGSTATPYEPYTGTSVTISLGQTVYGGTLNVLTGVLTVDSQLITGDANWGNYWNSHKAEQVDTNRNATFSLTLTNPTDYAQRASCKCNMLVYDGGLLAGHGNKLGYCLHPTLNKYIYVCLPLDTLGMSSATSATSDADFRNAINAMGDNLQIVIPLATPQTYTLDPQTVRTLVGQNNIFADTGNVALEYWAHP